MQVEIITRHHPNLSSNKPFVLFLLLQPENPPAILAEHHSHLLEGNSVFVVVRKNCDVVSGLVFVLCMFDTSLHWLDFAIVHPFLRTVEVSVC